ncbi:hypothetical protein [Kosakonia radicincitans]|uniref:hypothetical protein n=1 Tax=Kosakonia radicincitans TaxID=283686 RepID=UPI001D07982A|nr:hypothetical protein [Kosakonia radicincitans]
MSLQKKTTRRTGIRLTHHRRDWMAGLHWAPQHSALRVRLRGRASPDTHCVTAGRGSASMPVILQQGENGWQLAAF